MEWKFEDRTFAQEAARRGISVEQMVDAVSAQLGTTTSRVTNAVELPEIDGRPACFTLAQSAHVGFEDRRDVKAARAAGFWAPEDGQLHWRVSSRLLWDGPCEVRFTQTLREAIATAEAVWAEHGP